MFEILGLLVELVMEAVFAIVVRIPQFFFYVLTVIWNWFARCAKGSR